MAATWNVIGINPKTKKRIRNGGLQETFGSKDEAEQAIVNCIRGASNKKEALKYFRTLSAFRIYKPDKELEKIFPHLKQRRLNEQKD